MIVCSFVRDGWKLVPIEVEVYLSAGLPQIQIMGQADAVIKESTTRVKSALKAQGFEFPRAQTILVNLRPHYLKKQSCGLDLAIAFGILCATEQIPKFPWQGDKIFAYGELGLTGEVKAPEDLGDLFDHSKESPILTGEGTLSLDYDYVQIKNLNDLKKNNGELVPQKGCLNLNFQRPEDFWDLQVSDSLAQLLKIIAHGEHSTLFAGPSGSGKTTAARIAHTLLVDPDKTIFFLSRLLSRLNGYKLKWRPFVAPHHTITEMGLLGGGAVPHPGEISRAHGGVLLLDELLEFSSRAQEGLREPFEQGEITVARAGKCSVFPARSLIMATTNLCPCGKWVPKKVIHCNRSARKCMAYLERLSGPLLDRFTILSFSHKWEKTKTQSIETLFQELEKSRQFSSKKITSKKIVNEHLSLKEIEKDITPFVLKNLLPEFSSMRRKLSLFRVARTIADLKQEEKIDEKTIQEASQYTVRSFHDLSEQRM